LVIPDNTAYSNLTLGNPKAGQGKKQPKSAAVVTSSDDESSELSGLTPAPSEIDLPQAPSNVATAVDDDLHNSTRDDGTMLTPRAGFDTGSEIGSETETAGRESGRCLEAGSGQEG
jgi:hypothetical protein